MKKYLFIFISLTLCLFTAQAAFADLDGDATSHVYVMVDPNVAVGVVDANVNLGSVQMGDFSATITFRVDANMEDVHLSASVSQLYKGDDPANPDNVLPLAIVESDGVIIDPANANPMAGADSVADYVGGLVDIGGGFMGLLTDSIHFEASQNGHFSQDVDLTMSWTQPDPEQPQGEYSGLVKMFCLLTP